jgi:hypothetical protein
MKQDFARCIMAHAPDCPGNQGAIMRVLKTACLTLAALSAITAAAAPAFAGPHRHQVCHTNRVHGHPQRVCHWVG